MTASTQVKLQSSDGVEMQVGNNRHIPSHPRLTHTDMRLAREVAERSVLIKNIVGDLGEEALTEAIPISNVCQYHLSIPSPTVVEASMLTILQVNEAVLKKVIEWCEHHKADPPATNEDDADSRKKTTDIEEWDQKFMQVDQEMLFEIILVSSS